MDLSAVRWDNNRHSSSQVSLSVIFSRLLSSQDLAPLGAWTRDSDSAVMRVDGAAGSLPAFVLTYLHEELHAPIITVTPCHESAILLQGDLVTLAADPSEVLLFPPEAVADDNRLAETIPVVQRMEVVTRLLEGYSGIISTTVDALLQPVPLNSSATEHMVLLHEGQEWAPHDLMLRLLALSFERVDFVELPGEIAWRGGIVDIYGYSGGLPVRIEYFGDEIESIRAFDPETQLSVEVLSTVRIIPNLDQMGQTASEGQDQLLSLLPPNSLIATFDQLRFEEADHGDKSLARILHSMAAFRRISFGAFGRVGPADLVIMESNPQPSFGGNLRRLRQHIHRNASKGTDSYLLCDSPAQKTRMDDLLSGQVESDRLQLTVASLHRGFETPMVAVYTDHELFGRQYQPRRRRRRLSGGLRQHELRRLQPGDYVVHGDHGVGKFTGFHKVTVRGKQQEALRILFAGDDVLYVNVNAVNKLSRYTGKDGHQPRLTTLGSGQWQRSKARAKSRIKDLARDLIRLYSRRKSTKGHAFAGDTVWQREMEAAFKYEDTPDQSTVTREIKADMEADAPMDRLVCGDVGFGKTEIAIRAAFKAVVDGKQVAVLVPTTVLARQHYDTFSKRLQVFPIRLEMLSRFRTAATLRNAVTGIKDGTVDIAIGTHRLVSKDVAFKDLGLLIVDEEQRFGVGVKEKLRHLRVNVDTLTLTATPIPRTLQFSLLGARDLSIIETPPTNRQNIVTEVHSFDKDLIQKAIDREVSRGGQVFFIHNRVQSIVRMAELLKDLLPHVRFQVAHGQMKSSSLERIMLGFIDQKFEVLVCTTIIENGLDIANANTMIVNHAQRFGLAQLHQLRGRVGRSERRAYCYLMVPSVRSLTRDAIRRLQAVEELSNLGAGFNIAMRDLDIRGAGNLLGGEQSGFIAELGHATYQSVLDEAVRELKQEEYSSLPESTARITECSVAVEEEALIPDTYVSSHLERLRLYQRIGNVESADALTPLREELADRFGSLPDAVEHLFNAAAMKAYAQSMRLPRIRYRNQRLFLHFPGHDHDQLFANQIYPHLMAGLHALDHRFVLRESKRGTMRAIIQEVPDLNTACSLAKQLQVASLSPS